MLKHRARKPFANQFRHLPSGGLGKGTGERLRAGDEVAGKQENALDDSRC